MRKYRRDVLKTSGSLLCGGLLAGISSAKRKGAKGNKGKKKGDKIKNKYGINGSKKVKWKIRPDQIEVTKTLKSPDLKKRYNKTGGKIKKQKSVDRTDWEQDPYPKNDTQVVKEPWESVVTSESEFKGTEPTQDTQNEIGTQNLEFEADGLREIEEAAPCGIPVWDYEKLDENGTTVYERKSPFNVIIGGIDVNQMPKILPTTWGDFRENWCQTAAEWPRYAWDKDRNKMIGPDNNPLDEYRGWASECAGIFTSRYHLRCYELEDGVVAIQAHVDSPAASLDFGHSVTSYTRAEEKVHELVTDAGGTDRGEYDYNIAGIDGNDGGGAWETHDGTASLLELDYDSIDRNC